MYLLIVAFVIFFASTHISNGHKCPSPNTMVSMHDLKLAAKLSRLVYKEDVKLGDTIPGCSFKVTFIHDDKFATSKNDPGFRVFLVEHARVTFVVYRGTDTTEQLLQQGISQLMTLKGVTYKLAGVKTKVNQFFLNAFKLLQIKLRPRLRDPNRKYVLTGHSLGGAMASLLAIEMTQQYGGSVWNHSQSTLVTFGQPRVGDQTYADLHDRLISPWRKFRFVLNRDPVSHIPFAPDFIHHSREIYLDHHQTWIWSFPWLKYTKFWRVCENQEDSDCSSQFMLAWQVQDHMIDRYIEMIDQLPSIFETTKHAHKSSFADALIGSC